MASKYCCPYLSNDISMTYHWINYCLDIGMTTWHFYLLCHLLEHRRRNLPFFLLTELVKEGTEPCAWWGVIWQVGGLEVTTLLLAGAGGTNTDSWNVSFAPCLELAASCRVAQHPAGYCGDPSAVARPAHPVPFVPITTSHPVQAMPVVHSATWQC